MHSVFVDSDVIIDLLIDRQPHANASSKIFQLSDYEKIKIGTSTLCISNIHYIIRKYLGTKKAKSVIADLIEMIDVLEVSRNHIEKALNSKIYDFEDAIQNYVACDYKNIDAIITRNIKDFKSADLPVLDPESFCKIIENES
ncbi:MAG: PIN domain-containing protein [Reichenbachiella sp.]